MKTTRSKVLVELACSVGVVWAIYLTLWIANIHETSRRWTLFVCLFAVWLSFNLGWSIGRRAERWEGANQRQSQEMGVSLARVVWSFVAMVGIMLSLGLVLRVTA